MRLLKKSALIWLLFLLVASCHHLLAPPPNQTQSWGQQKTFDYQGLKINYYEAGHQGTPIILLHGFGASAYAWRYLAPRLAADHRVFTLDLKGFGLSDKPPDGKYAIQDQAGLVAAFIRSKKLPEVVLMGNSMGGAVSLLTYLTLQEGKPGPIKALVLIDSAGYPQKLPWFVRLAQVPVLNTLGPMLLPPRFLTAQVLRQCYYDKGKITDEIIATYAYYSNLPGAAAAVRQTAAQIEPRNMEALIKRYQHISVPTLIIWGEQDEVIPLAVGRKLARDIPGAQLVVFPRCGHIPQEEEPRKTLNCIQDFLKEKF
ncbi:MAG: alpha/beta hydrolase [Syntrophales bacterium]|nr:alpha/beta hydrolase [Syntrophales bacterium]